MQLNFTEDVNEVSQLLYVEIICPAFLVGTVNSYDLKTPRFVHIVGEARLSQAPIW